MTSPVVGPPNDWDLICTAVGLAGVVSLAVGHAVMRRTHGFDPAPVPFFALGGPLVGVGLGWWMCRAAFAAILFWQAHAR